MATGYYAGAQNGIWTATGAWKSTLAGATNATAPTTGNTAFFNNNALTAARNVYLSGAKTISQIITNTNALNGITIRGGTLAVPATQTLTIASGTVQGAGSGSLTFHSTCTVFIPNNSALDTQSGTSLIFDGRIQGQNISQTGSGTVTFNNASFLPSYTVVGGTCNINNAAALGNPSVGAIFEIQTGGTAFLNVALENNYGGAGNSFTFAGGTVVINNAGFQNVRSAFTALTSSILRATLSASLGGGELNLGSTASLTVSAASGITLTINSGITGNGTGSLSFGRAADTGVVTLAGASSTVLNVTTFVNFGTVVCSTATPLGAASSTSGISVAAVTSLQLNTAVTYASRTVAISGTGSVNAPNNGALIIGNTGENTFSGITLGATAYIRATSSGTLTGGILTDSATGKNLTAGAASGVTLTLSSAITGGGTLTVGNHSSDTGTLKISASSTIGNTSITYGTAQAGHTNAFGSTGTVTIASGTTLQTLTASGQNGKLTVAALNNAAGGTTKIGG
jgi:hypothetical protein